MLMGVMMAAVLGVQPTAGETAWVKAHAMPLAAVEAGHGFEDLAGLRAMVGDARVVSLGEPTHGTREAFQMKHRLLEYLASEMGFTVFSIEASMPEAYRLNDYVLRGEGDPKAGIAGMHFWTWDTEEVLAMVEWMRAFNASGRGPVQFTGFDMQFDGAARDNARALVAQAEPEYLAELDRQYAVVKSAGEAGDGGGAGILAGTFPVAMARGKHVVYSGEIRTAGLEGVAGLWWRVDGPGGKVLAFDNMQDRGAKGTSGWRTYTIALDVPPEAENISFGLIVLARSGTAWFDSLSVKLGEMEFRDPEAFDLGFEGESHAGLVLSTPEYRAVLDANEPATGAKCLRVECPGVKMGATPKDAADAAEAVLRHMEGAEEGYAKAVGAARAAWGVQNARVVAQCVRMRRADAEKDQTESVQRDYAMAENVKWIADQNPGARMVLWAHNGHVCREAGSMGRRVEALFPGSQVVVGFSTSTGRYTAVRPGQGLSEENELQKPLADSVEAYLDSAGVPRMVLDVRAKNDDPDAAASAWLGEKHPFRMVGALAMTRQQWPRVIRGNYDLIVHLKETTAAKGLWQVMSAK